MENKLTHLQEDHLKLWMKKSKNLKSKREIRKRTLKTTNLYKKQSNKTIKINAKL